MGKKQGQRAPYIFCRYAPPFQHNLAVAAKLRDNVARKHPKGHNLDAASARAGRTANKHEGNEHQQCGVAHQGKVYGTEARRARHHRMKKHGNAQIKTAFNRVGHVAPAKFYGKHGGPARHNEHDTGLDHHAAVTAQTPHGRPHAAPGADAQKFAQHTKTNATQNNTARNDGINGHIIPEKGQICCAEAKSCVAKGRYGMEYRAERIEKNRVVEPQQQCGHSLYAKNQPQHLPQKGGNAKIAPQQGLAHRLAAVEWHVVAPEQKNDAGIGHHAQAASLDKAQQHPLAKGAEHCADIHR